MPQLRERSSSSGHAPRVEDAISAGVRDSIRRKSSVIGGTVIDPAAAVAVQKAKELTIEDVDNALENLLTQWHAGGNATPLPLSRQFAARARFLGWVEGVEFDEVR